MNITRVYISLLIYIVFHSSSGCSTKDNPTNRTPYLHQTAPTPKIHKTQDIKIGDNNPDFFKIESIEDSTSIMFKKVGKTYEIVDTIIHYTTFTDSICPNFSVEDFNQDGYNDVVAWVDTDVYGNHWTKIYLYNPAINNFQIIRNNTEPNISKDIWPAPDYHKNNHTIHCQLISGVYDVSFTSIYKLIEYSAIPIAKKEEDATNTDYIISNRYYGKNGKWVLSKSTKLK